MLKNRYLNAVLSSAISIIPIIAIIMLLSIIPFNSGVIVVQLHPFDYFALVICALVLILGNAFFQIGTDQGLSKIGDHMGASLSKQSHLFVVVIFAFLLGALITCAEPSILIVASQVNIPSTLLIGSIAIGVGIFVVVGVIRIFVHGSLKLWYLMFYFITFLLICLIAIDDSSRNFLPFIFDSGGITTGSATVPFILALGIGIATVRGGRNAAKDSFGLVGMASIGPIITMTLLILFNKSSFSAYVVNDLMHFDDAGSVFSTLFKALLPASSGSSLGSLIEVTMALVPILIIFFIYELIFIKLPKKEIGQIMLGILYCYIGLVVFLTGINSIMSPFGNLVGQGLGKIDNNALIILICFVIGVVTILCEPAVHSLTESMSKMTDGNINRRTVLITLCIGVGVAIALSALRTIYRFNIMYIIVPGYMLSILLMVICPDIYTAMAFDSGGTASGPTSVSFVLPMIVGIAYNKNIHQQSSIAYYTDAFGVVSLIALTPIIAIQLLGVASQFKKIRQLRINAKAPRAASDRQIIHF